MNFRCTCNDSVWQDVERKLEKLSKGEGIALICETLKGKATDARMCTLTPNGCQFRVWNQVPCSFGYDHVDGFDPYGTLSVDGYPMGVKSYCDAIVTALELTEVRLPNGGRIYLKMR